MMERILEYDEIDTSWYDNIDDEIGLYWENDEIEEKFDRDYPHEQFKHLKVATHREIHAK